MLNNFIMISIKYNNCNDKKESVQVDEDRKVCKIINLSYDEK